MNYKCTFGNLLDGSDSWNPGSESAKCGKRKLFRAIPRRISAFVVRRNGGGQQKIKQLLLETMGKIENFETIKCLKFCNRLFDGVFIAYPVASFSKKSEMSFFVLKQYIKIV